MSTKGAYCRRKSFGDAEQQGSQEPPKKNPRRGSLTKMVAQGTNTDLTFERIQKKVEKPEKETQGADPAGRDCTCISKSRE